MKLRISVHQSVHYHQDVFVTPKDFEELKQASDKTITDGDSSPITSLLNMSDVCGWGDFSDLEIIEVDDSGNPVEGGYERFEF